MNPELQSKGSDQSRVCIVRSGQIIEGPAAADKYEYVDKDGWVIGADGTPRYGPVYSAVIGLSNAIGMERRNNFGTCYLGEAPKLLREIFDFVRKHEKRVPQDEVPIS